MTDNKIFLILTRPVSAHAGFVDELSSRSRSRLQIVPSPLMEIRPVAEHQTCPENYAAIFTSTNGVRFAPAGQGRGAFCVGSATTSAAREAGWAAEYLGENAKSLIAALIEASEIASLVHFSGRHQRGDIVENLRSEGIMASRYVVYDQVLLPLSETAQNVLAGTSNTLVPLFSLRTAAHFAALTPPRQGLYLVAISEEVASVLPEKLRKCCSVACSPTAKAVAMNIEKLLAKDSLG